MHIQSMKLVAGKVVLMVEQAEGKGNQLILITDNSGSQTAIWSGVTTLDSEVTGLGNDLYYTTQSITNSNAYTLWKFDGKSRTQISPPVFDNLKSVRALGATNTTLFYTADDGTGQELWRLTPSEIPRSI